jgi:hypothetical protein
MHTSSSSLHWQLTLSNDASLGDVWLQDWVPMRTLPTWFVEYSVVNVQSIVAVAVNLEQRCGLEKCFG